MEIYIMALINCPECQTEVSDTSFNCSKCGFQLRKPTRSFFGKLIKWAFIGFNALMLIWIFAGVHSASQNIDTLSGAEKAGATIGTGLGAMLLVVIWVLGDIILGLFVFFTRPKR
jgi:hypothetical protein